MQAINICVIIKCGACFRVALDFLEVCICIIITLEKEEEQDILIDLPE